MRNTKFKLFLSMCLLVISCSLMSAQSQKYYVDHIVDGDTIFVNKINYNGSKENKSIKVRMFGIDAPEISQDYGTNSRDYLSSLLKGKTVEIRGGNYDRYGRLLAVVYLNNENINEKMIQTGNAWWYDRYDPKNKNSKKYLEEAKKKKIGIFSRANYIEPWKFRKDKNQ